MHQAHPLLPSSRLRHLRHKTKAIHIYCRISNLCPKVLSIQASLRLCCISSRLLPNRHMKCNNRRLFKRRRFRSKPQSRRNNCLQYQQQPHETQQSQVFQALQASQQTILASSATTNHMQYQQQPYEAQKAQVFQPPQASQQTTVLESATTNYSQYQQQPMQQQTVQQQTVQQPPMQQQPIQRQPMMIPQPQISSQPPFVPLELLQADQAVTKYTTPTATISQAPPFLQAAPPSNTSSSVVTTTTKRTEKYKDANAGGKARNEAETKGDAEVRRFEQKVQKLIKRVGICPLGKPWYNSLFGYICAEGIHFLWHKDIDMAFKQPGWIPQVLYVNTFYDPERLTSGTLHASHPPPVDFHQPMHRTHREFMRMVRESGAFFGRECKKGIKEQSGCDEDCVEGLNIESQKDADRILRQAGFDPYATRHRKFMDQEMKSLK